MNKYDRLFIRLGMWKVTRKVEGRFYNTYYIRPRWYHPLILILGFYGFITEILKCVLVTVKSMCKELRDGYTINDDKKV